MHCILSYYFAVAVLKPGPFSSLPLVLPIRLQDHRAQGKGRILKLSGRGQVSRGARSQPRMVSGAFLA